MKLALVTGSCRRLGAHIAARLAEQGHAVALHGSRDPQVEPWLVDRLRAVRAEWRPFAADLADPSAAEALVDRVAEHFGVPVTLLVNNASRFDAGDGAEPSMTALVDHFRVNAAAAVVLANALARQAGGDAAVVNILDQRIAGPNRDQLAYTLSKQALAEATRTLAVTLAPRVRVNAVAPGLTLPTGDYLPGQHERLAALMPLRRLPTPDEVADAVLHLAAARSTTGQILFVDGGAGLTRFERDFVNLARD